MSLEFERIGIATGVEGAVRLTTEATPEAAALLEARKAEGDVWEVTPQGMLLRHADGTQTPVFTDQWAVATAGGGVVPLSDDAFRALFHVEHPKGKAPKKTKE